MALIKTISPESDEGKKLPAFAAFRNMAGMVPKPIEMFSASPSLAQIYIQILQYYRNHPTLEMPLLSTIRYLVAHAFDHKPCIEFNGELLKKQGMEIDDLELLVKDPLSAPLEGKDVAMLIFVIQALKTPRTVSRKDIDRLHSLGWSDRDILDALFHGALLVGPSLMIKALQFDR